MHSPRRGVRIASVRFSSWLAPRSPNVIAVDTQVTARVSAHGGASQGTGLAQSSARLEQ